MEDDGDYCSDCKRATQVAYDRATGDSICTECGLIRESRIVDETPEWSSFSNDDGQDKDPVRVGPPSSPFLYGRNMLETTLVPNVKDGRIQIPRITIAIATADKSRTSLCKAFGKIDELCQSLAVNKTVKDLACDIYSKVLPFKIETRRDNSIAAACVHIASQKLNQSRTLREMRMATGGLAEKKIVIAKNSIMKVLNDKVGSSSVSSMELGSRTDNQHVNDYLKRFAHELGLNNQAIKAAQEILTKSEEQDIRRTPKSIAVGIIYVTCLLCRHKRTVRDISFVANTSEGTIKKSYKDLYPYLHLIVPSWFASQNELRKLHEP